MDHSVTPAAAKEGRSATSMARTSPLAGGAAAGACGSGAGAAAASAKKSDARTMKDLNMVGTSECIFSDSLQFSDDERTLALNVDYGRNFESKSIDSCMILYLITAGIDFEG